MGGSVGVGVGESGGWVDGPRKSWWLFVGLSSGHMPGCVGGLVGMWSREEYWVGGLPIGWLGHGKSTGWVDYPVGC